jgi:amino acid transporter
MADTQADRSPQNTGAMLGTFAGVFTPSILTILGIILFLRTGYVVGNGGLVGALLIIAIATAVSILTSISLAAIATNIDVKGGGDYYLISRTLGLEFGGAIGVVLFLAQSVSIAFYAIGFGEATSALAGWDSRLVVQVIAAIAVLVLFAFAWAGADVATKLQFVVMVVLVAALVSFYIGSISAFDSQTFGDSWTPPSGAVGFWVAFAIFFPAVTGFTQGVSMSGDLRNPGRSLPIGTFTAVGLSTVVYVSVAVLLAGGVPLSVLVTDDGSAMRHIAVIGALVALGVIAATLSSSMASLLGAPRILQSMASDRVFPLIGWFAEGEGDANNPRRAVVLSLAIAMATILLGSVNVIAPVVSMFFLVSYGLINYATYYEARAGSPSFRPRFRFFNKGASLAGAILCAAAMLAINPIAGAAAIVLLFLIYQYLRRRAIPERWADAAHSHHFQRAVESIRALDGEIEHARNWRPQILVFSADTGRRARLLTFAKWIEGNSGLTAAFRIVSGKGIRKRIETDRQQEELQSEIADLGLEVHGRAVLAADGMDALPVIVQSFGLGRIRANVVLFGWPESPDQAALGSYVGAISDVARLGVSVMSLSTDELRWGRFTSTPRRRRNITLWWEDDDSGRLALMTAYLCTRDPEWQHATIRLVADAGQDANDTKAHLESMLEGARIDADVVTINQPTSMDIVGVCADATLVLMPMRLRRGELLDPFGEDMIDLAAKLPMTAAIHAGAPIVLETDPASGLAESLATAERSADEARERLRKLEHQLDDANAEVTNLRNGEGAEPAHREEAMAEAQDRFERIHRRTLSARARVERANADVQVLLQTRRHT